MTFLRWAKLFEIEIFFEYLQQFYIFLQWAKLFEIDAFIKSYEV